ncbi:hypothetical protein LEL_06251 [Akanthomyces lecanii RCEF 1005]|uniref:Uncharacterized protein n=1 Tax=Akanthomyces lecanii RCEF 1005 TaxID=1081108 RepID=A0A168GJK8_CORDF|nr:hypothetical protein LEL_06251 [Akanthomyces lecanii RCEF 1005]
MPTCNASSPGVAATAYATAYANSWTDPANDFLSGSDLALLAHVNCAYLSTPQRPPTLLALKQHAQSLAVLIQRISVSHTRALVNEHGVRDPDEHFAADDAFDWLNDLRTPYANDDESHHLPIKSLMNTVAQESEREGPRMHCPLQRIGAQNSGDDDRPFATHQNLVMHANACLEILDHEYSATGGLMSILPSAYDGDAAQLDAARNTLLGQWLLHHQDLIARLHELEINYTNALAAVEGRAVAPLHSDTADGSSSNEAAAAGNGGGSAPAPQNELVIVGHRTHAYGRIHALLDRAEAHVESKQKLWWERGVSGERTWMQSRGGDWYARGLIPLDLETRFFRIKGQGRAGTLFMMPAVKQNAALEHLVEMEARPTVVSVVTPKWAERATALESKIRARKVRMDEDGEEEEEEEGGDAARVQLLQDMLAVRDADLKQANTAVMFYEQRVDKDSKEQVRTLKGLMGDFAIDLDKI